MSWKLVLALVVAFIGGATFGALLALSVPNEVRIVVALVTMYAWWWAEDWRRCSPDVEQ